MARRIMEKNGKPNILSVFGREYEWYHLNFLDMQWYYFVMLFCLLHVISFAFFGAVYYITMEYHRLDFLQQRNLTCFFDISDIFAAYLFSLETQQTIGYGSRGISDVCPDAVVLMIFHTLFGIILSSIFSGTFLAKFLKSGSTSAVRFSRKALITMRNGSLHLVIRMADTKGNDRDRGVYFNAYCVQDIIYQGENIPLQIHHMDFGFQLDGTNNLIPLLYPTCVSHKIDNSSPLYGIGPDELPLVRLEIIVNISSPGIGVFDSTSYTQEEIIWGARFTHERVLSRLPNIIFIDFSQVEIDRFELDLTPRRSAKCVEKIVFNST